MNSYTLSELNNLIEDVLSVEFDHPVWVRAEISSLQEKGGHLYIDLVEKSERGLLSAKQRATCWSDVQVMLRAYFEQTTGAPLQVGMQVLLEVELRFHSVYGISLNIINIDPSYTLGGIAQQRQQTINQLKKEGVWEMQHELDLPVLTRRLAVISSATAAGYDDFEHQLKASGYKYTMALFEATMQGEGAARSIMSALDAIIMQEEEWDAVVIIRGGGASSDLSCFDDYSLCAHVAQFPLPILSGIGHTRDVSILDMVAYMPLKTPTAVAAFLNNRMDGQWQRIETLGTRLKQTAERQIMIRQHRIELLQQRISACSPERFYKMGYSLVTTAKQVIRSKNDVQPGDRITIHLQDGQISSKVL